MAPRDAVRLVAQARTMTPRAEQTRLAWASGEIDGDRAEAIATAVNDLPADAAHRAVEAAQADLIADARTLPLAEVRAAAAGLLKRVDPANADRIRGEQLAAQEHSAYERAVFRGRKGADGLATFSGAIPSLHYDMLKANLEAIASPRRDHLRDPAASCVDGGDTAATADQRQIPAVNRLGRALCDWIEKIDEQQLPAAGVNATLVVTVDEQTLRNSVGTATVSTGDEVSAGEVRRLACGTGILPLVLGGDSAVLDAGQAKRLFDKCQRAALSHRDQGCAFPGCDRPPAWTEAHHVTPWARGGNTDLGNGVLLCGHHHRLIHAGEWAIRIAADGIPEVTPPARIDPLRGPIRHERFRHRHRQRPRPGAG
jgi:hypothetical protein